MDANGSTLRIAERCLHCRLIKNCGSAQSLVVEAIYIITKSILQKSQLLENLCFHVLQFSQYMTDLPEQRLKTNFTFQTFLQHVPKNLLM